MIKVKYIERKEIFPGIFAGDIRVVIQKGFPYKICRVLKIRNHSNYFYLESYMDTNIVPFREDQTRPATEEEVIEYWKTHYMDDIPVKNNHYEIY